MTAQTSLIVITGSMGAGKTSVMAEASDLLRANGIVHAAIDADALDVAHLPPDSPDDMMLRNLHAVWSNYAALGVTKLLVAIAVETVTELELIRRAVDGGPAFVVRLTARIETMERRIAARETGMLQATFVARVITLEAILNDARLESVTIDNDHRSITDVARELLARAGWL